MPNQVYSKLLLIIVIMLNVNGCTPGNFFNGVYADNAAMKSSIKRERAYYDSKTPEWRAALKKNSIYCDDLANRPENLWVTTAYPNGTSNTGMYERCLKEKGTPNF